MANMEKHDTPEVLTVLNHAISVSYKSNYISANKLVLYQKKKYSQSTRNQESGFIEKEN